MLDRISIDTATEPRNIVHVNFMPDNLGFLASWLAKRARLVHVRELGSAAASVSINLPVVSPARVILPASASYMQWSPDSSKNSLPVVIGYSLSPRMLVVQEVRSAGFLSEVCRVFRPDILALGSGIARGDTGYQDQDLASTSDAVTRTELAEWGMHDAAFWANEVGARSLRHSLAMFDSYCRRRKKEAARVYDVGDLLLCDGFYPVESQNGNQWAWTGSETVATLLLPNHGSGRLKITLFLFGTKIPIGSETMQIFVNGDACACGFFLNEKIEIVTGYLRPGCSHRVDIFQSRMTPTTDGSRQIGFALHKVKVEIAS